MSKQDPAFLFYFQDYAFGTRFLNRKEKGAYVDLLVHQADKFSSKNQYKMTVEEIMEVLGNDKDVWEKISEKFEKKSELFWNQKLLLVQQERRIYTESRRMNRIGKILDEDMKNICESYVKHMEDEDVNVIEDVINTLKAVDGFNEKFYEWFLYRKQIGKKLIPKTILKQLKFLSKQPDPKLCIDNSIQNQWQGLFEVKNGIQNSKVGATADELARIATQRAIRNKG